MTTMDVQWNWQSVCPPRVMRSLFAGAVAGGLIFAISHLAGSVLAAGSFYAMRHDLLAATALFVAAFLIWLIALVAFALGPWWVFHRVGFRNLFSALVLGFAMTFLVDLGVVTHCAGLLSPSLPPGAHEMIRDGAGDREIDYVLTRRGLRFAVEGAAELGLIGALVAAVIWRTAYCAPKLRS